MSLLKSIPNFSENNTFFFGFIGTTLLAFIPLNMAEDSNDSSAIGLLTLMFVILIITLIFFLSIAYIKYSTIYTNFREEIRQYMRFHYDLDLNDDDLYHLSRRRHTGSVSAGLDFHLKTEFHSLPIMVFTPQYLQAWNPQYFSPMQQIKITLDIKNGSVEVRQQPRWAVSERTGEPLPAKQ